MTDANREEPGEGSTPLRAATLDEGGIQRATTARVASAARRPGLWLSYAALVVVCASLGWATGGLVQAIIVSVGGVAFAWWITVRAMMKSIRATYPRNTAVVATTDGAGLTLTTPDGSWHTDWVEIASFESRRQHLLLRPKGVGGPIVLAPGLFGEDTVNALRAAGVRDDGGE